MKQTIRGPNGLAPVPNKLKSVSYEIKKTLDSAVSRVNEEVNGFVNVLKQRTDVLPFNSDLPIAADNNTDRIIEATIAHRITNYWEVPNKEDEKRRFNATFRKWMQVDEQAGKARELFAIRYILGENQRLEDIGTAVLAMLRSEKSLDHIGFGPGESFKSSQGRTHLAAKLDPYSQTVSEQNLDLWVSVIIRVRWLFLPFVEAYAKIHKDQGMHVLYPNTGLSYEISEEIVRFVISSIDGYVVVGSRQAQVPKENEYNRMIEVNPFGDIVLQKIVGMCFRRALKRYGIDLDENQSLHYSLISQDVVSTIDAKSASDLITRWHIENSSLPSKLKDIIIRLSHSLVVYKNEYNDYDTYVQKKLCSMGNGFTFELLTTLFYSICWKARPSLLYVYGDDIIVDNEHASLCVFYLKKCGFLINEKKTFINSCLRESCGGFFIDGVGYIRSYKIEYAANIVECIALVNKLWRIAYWLYEKNVHSFLKQDLSDLWFKCLSHLEPCLMAPYGKGEVSDVFADLSCYVEIPQFMRRYIERKDRKNSKKVALRSLDSKVSELRRNYQKSVYPVMVCSLKPKVDVKKKKDSVRSPCLVGAYLFNGTVSDMHYSSDVGYNTVIKLAYVDDIGSFLS